MSNKKNRNNGNGAIVNRLCPCGSNKKYKKCCLFKGQGYVQDEKTKQWNCAHKITYITTKDKEKQKICYQCKRVIETTNI